MLMVLLHTHARCFFSLFSKACWPGVLKKVKKIRQRACNSTISMDEGGKNQLFYSLFFQHFYCYSILCEAMFRCGFGIETRHQHIFRHAKNTSWERKSYGCKKKWTKKLLFDSLLMNILAKWWKNDVLFAKIKNYGNQKWWIRGFVNMVFGGSTGVSLKSSGRRSTAVDNIYTLKTYLMCRSHQQLSNGGLVISRRRL